jgi:hypothetical protein
MWFRPVPNSFLKEGRWFDDLLATPVTKAPKKQRQEAHCFRLLVDHVHEMSYILLWIAVYYPAPFLKYCEGVQ